MCYFSSSIKNFIIRFFCIIPTLLLCFGAFAQNEKLHGTVLDFYSKRPLDAVSVFTTSGRNTITDSLGRFIIVCSKKDSVWFSYINKNTQKYPADTISNFGDFTIALHVDAAWLPAVKVRNSNYYMDSLQNRLDYAKVFNFKKPSVGIVSSSPSNYNPGALTAGFDLTELINMFRFRRNKQILSMQERLLKEEEDKYINHRFTKLLVKKLTRVDSSRLQDFMEMCRPSYELLTTMNDIELGYYIEQCYKIYERNGRLEPLMVMPQGRNN